MTLPFHHTAVWYDRHTRSWVVQLLDDRDNQIGDADFVATKGEAVRYKNSHLITRYLAAYKASALKPFGGDVLVIAGWFKVISGTSRIVVREKEFIAMCERLEARVE
jgi:hypothetical protein